MGVRKNRSGDTVLPLGFVLRQSSRFPDAMILVPGPSARVQAPQLVAFYEGGRIGLDRAQDVPLVVRHRLWNISKQIMKPNKHRVRRNARGLPLDQERADDLKLYIDNDGRLYEMNRMYRAALAKRAAKGTFRLDLAAKGFGWIVEEGAKKYVREFPPETGLTKWSDVFSPATRSAVAKEMAKDWYDEYRIEHGIKANKRTSRRGLRRNSMYLPAGTRVVHRDRGGYATVRQWHGENVQIEWDEGPTEWVPVSKISLLTTSKSGSSRRNPARRTKRTSRRNAGRVDTFHQARVMALKLRNQRVARADALRRVQKEYSLTAPERRSLVRSVWGVTENRKRTSRRARRTSRRAA